MLMSNLCPLFTELLETITFLIFFTYNKSCLKNVLNSIEVNVILFKINILQKESARCRLGD